MVECAAGSRRGEVLGDDQCEDARLWNSLIRDYPQQLSTSRGWNRKGGARDLPKKDDDDMQSVMKKNRDAVPKKK